MALIDLPSTLEWPFWPANYYNSNNVGSNTDISTSAERIAYIFIAPKTGSIEQFHFQQGPLINAQDVHFSIQDVDSEFKPDGTEDEFVVLASGSMTANTQTATGPITSTGAGGGTRRSVTKGDKLALVVRFDATVGDVDFTTGITATGGMGLVPNVLVSTNSGSTWSEQDRLPNLAIEYVTDGIVYHQYLFPLETSAASASFNINTTPDEMAMKFQLPFAGRCKGAFFNGATANVVYSIETAGGSVVAGPDFTYEDTSNAQKRYVEWTTPVELDINTDYYLIWTPNTVTSRTHRWFNLDAATKRAALPSGVTSSYNTRTNGGAWTEDTLKTISFALAFDQIDDGQGGGGGGACELVNGTAVIPASCPV